MMDEEVAVDSSQEEKSVKLNGDKKLLPIGARKFKDKFGFHKVYVYDGLEALEHIIKFRIKQQQKKQDTTYLVSGLEGCQPKGSKVLMATGEFKNIEDIKEGDYILSPQPDGKNIFSKVLSTTKWFSQENYEVRTLNRKKRLLYKCSGNHIIPLNFIRTKGHTHRKREWYIKQISASKYAGEKWSTKQNCTSLLSFPIEYFFEEKECSIDAYALGVYLGDGNLSNKKNSKRISITSNDPIVLDEINKIYPIMSVHNKTGTTCKTYSFSIYSEFYKELLFLGLANKKSGEKFIPKEALLSSIEYRKRLLAGLIDTDAYFSRDSYIYTTKSEKLADDLCFLLGSLGIRFTKNKTRKTIKKTGFSGEYFNIGFYLQKDMNIPILTDRRKKFNNDFYKSSNRLSIDLKESEPEMVYGFTIDSPSSWYITDNWMITHNTGKSQFCLWGADIYMEESGNKIDVSHITRNLKELFGKVYKLRENPSFISLDEGAELDGSNAMTKGVRKTKEKFTIMRKCSHIIFVCFVNPLRITTYFREDRIRGLFFVVKHGEVWFYSNNQDNPHLVTIIDSWRKDHDAKSLKFLKRYAPDMILKNIPEYHGWLRKEYESRKDSNIFNTLKEDEEEEEEEEKDILVGVEWLNIAHASKITGWKESTLRQMHFKGKLQTIRIRGRICFNKSELLDYVNKGSGINI